MGKLDTRLELFSPDIWRVEISTGTEISAIWRKWPFEKWPKYTPLTTKIAIFRDTRFALGQAAQNPVKTLKRKFLVKKLILISIADIEIFRNRYHQFSKNLPIFSRILSFDFYLHFQNKTNFRILNMYFALSSFIFARIFVLFCLAFVRTW